MQGLLILFPVFGGEKAAAKIRTVKGLRVEIFSRPLRKNTTRPLTVWIAGTAAEAVPIIGIGEKYDSSLDGSDSRSG